MSFERLGDEATTMDICHARTVSQRCERMNQSGALIERSEEVATALGDGRAVVALESTILAHGLPYPENLAVGQAIEAAVRESGAIPATIAVFDGIIKVGLETSELEELTSGASRFAKASARDLGFVLAAGASAATTVSATALVAARAGIRLFATGGIGGVHRGDQADVSQDLTMLAGCPVAVVSAGCKAILDLPRTLEMLETLGVPVVGHRTRDFPAFYSRSSGLTIDQQLEEPAEHARFLVSHWALLPNRGVLIANPIPEDAALDREPIEQAIEIALARAAERRIKGKALTPFLLAALAEITEGRSVVANRTLAIDNAHLAGQIAVALCGALTCREQVAAER